MSLDTKGRALIARAGSDTEMKNRWSVVGVFAADGDRYVGAVQTFLTVISLAMIIRYAIGIAPPSPPRHIVRGQMVLR